MITNQHTLSVSSVCRLMRVTSCAALATLLFGACNSGRDQSASDVDTTRYQLATEAGPGQDPAIQLTPQVIKFQGAEYTIAVNRAPSDSLPLVKDSYGDPYRDNIVTINVSRNGELCFTQRFGKTNFAESATDFDLKTVTLGGMAFTRIDASGLHFGAQLCSPGDVEGGYAFNVTIPLGGGAAKIERDTSINNIADEYVD